MNCYKCEIFKILFRDFDNSVVFSRQLVKWHKKLKVKQRNSLKKSFNKNNQVSICVLKNNLQLHKIESWGYYPIKKISIYINFDKNITAVILVYNDHGYNEFLFITNKILLIFWPEMKKHCIIFHDYNESYLMIQRVHFNRARLELLRSKFS